MKPSNPVIWIEGIIGAGKTTLATKLSEALNLRLFLDADSEDLCRDVYSCPFVSFSKKVNFLR